VVVAVDQDGILVVEEVPVPSYLIRTIQSEHIQYQYLFKLVVVEENLLYLPIHHHLIQHMAHLEHHHILEHH
jgi:hypothetical protein